MKNSSILILALFLSFALFSCKEDRRTDRSQKERLSSSPEYSEEHRPQFHFSPPANWMNDPNGMVFYEGEYHLFYQYYPDSTVWGPMHWGHAVSKDLVYWENLAPALYPDSLGYIFSGSALIDWQNSSGLGSAEQPPMIAIFTYHDPQKEASGNLEAQTQGLAYSLDKGRTWEKYAQNPILPNPGIQDFRDPKVFWYEAKKHWVMALAAGDRVKIYTSKNLLQWSFASDFGTEYGSHLGVWECPDLFPLKLENSDEEKWIMLLSINPGGINGGSATQYFVGDFDGNRFSLDEALKEDLKASALDSLGKELDLSLWFDYGTDHYAGVTWSDIPESDGRRIFIAWMSNWNYANVVPTDHWRSAMTLPRSLHLSKDQERYRLISRPVVELEKLRQNKQDIPAQVVEGELDLGLDFSPQALELVLDLDLSDEKNQGLYLEFSNSKGEKISLEYDKEKQAFNFDRRNSGKTDFEESFPAQHTIPYTLQANRLSLNLFLDQASVELFVDQGRVAFTDIFFPNELYTQVKLRSKGGELSLAKGKAYALKSIWPAPR